MATPGKRLDDRTRRTVAEKLLRGDSVYRTARDFRLSEPTVRKIRKEMLTSFGKPCP